MKKLILLKLILLLSIPIFSQSDWQVVEEFVGPLNEYMWTPYSAIDPTAYELDGAAIVDTENISFEFDSLINKEVIVLKFQPENPPILGIDNNYYNFSVAMLYSYLKIFHGEIEMRASIPSAGNGNYYSRYWFYGDCNEEIDFFEAMDSDGNDLKSSVHCPIGTCNCHCSDSQWLLQDCNYTGYHVYNMEWYGNYISLKVDGMEYAHWNSSNNYEVGIIGGCDNPWYIKNYNVSGDQVIPENPMNILIDFVRNNQGELPIPTTAYYKIDYIKIKSEFLPSISIQNKNITYCYSNVPSILFAYNIDFAGNGTSVSVGDPNNVFNKGYCSAQATNNIHINKGFHAKSGSFFHAKISNQSKSFLTDNTTNIITDSIETVEKKITEQKPDNDFITIAPNPANESVKISSNSNIKQISITNNLGSAVYNEEINETEKQINVSAFNKGAYLVKVTLESEKIEFRKLIVQ